MKWAAGLVCCNEVIFKLCRVARPLHVTISGADGAEAEARLAGVIRKVLGIARRIENENR